MYTLYAYRLELHVEAIIERRRRGSVTFQHVVKGAREAKGLRTTVSGNQGTKVIKVVTELALHLNAGGIVLV